MQTDETKRQIGEGVREFILQFPPETPILMLPTGSFLESLTIGLWRGVLETSGDFPIHHLECDFNGLRPFVLVPLTTEVQNGVKASVGRAIGAVDWMSLKDLRALKIIEPSEFSLFEQEDPAAD